MTLKEKIYDKAPWPIKNLLVTLFNLGNLWQRRTGNYGRYKKLHKYYEKLDHEELLSIQKKKYSEFITHLLKSSDFYKSRLKDISMPDDMESLRSIPILEKDELKRNIKSVMTIKPSKGLPAFTGGTTGMPLSVVFTKDNFRERVAIIDTFREKHGYIYGKSKIAWFSGRKILSKNDEQQNRFWRYDPILRIRYYSTFHL